MLDDAVYPELDRRLAPVDAARAAAYPGDRAGRQPVHTCYVPADAVVPGLAAAWGTAALAALDEHGLPDLGLDPALVQELLPRVRAKLAREPIEDLRVDAEDGYRGAPEAEDGTYDYSAALGIAAAHQSADHPAADFAKQVMQVAVAGTGAHAVDGSTNVLPVGATEQVHAAWRLHAGLVRRALERGLYQGWDLHPAQLVTRYLATYAFFRGALPAAAQRLAAYLDRSDAGVLDEPATARALAGVLLRGLDCGALDEDEFSARGVPGRAELDRLAGRRPGGP